MRLREAIRAYFDVVQENGNEWTIRCPHPDHNDRKPSASVNIVKGLWCCYSCGAAGSVQSSFNGINIFYAEPDLSDQLDELDELISDPTPNFYSEAWLDQFDYGTSLIHDYWLGRGFSEDLISSYRLGFDFERNAATYPMRDPVGRILGVVRRSLNDDGPKYRYPNGVEKSKLLFNYHNIHTSGVVAITEGAVDALALVDSGIDAVALYGSRLHDGQVALLDRLPASTLCLCLDSDGPGRAAATEIISAGKLRQILVQVQLPTGYKDIAEVPQDQRVELIKDAKLVW